MDERRWQRVSAIFDEVADAEPDARTALLDHLCPDDAELRRDVEALLAADAGAAHFERSVASSRAATAAGLIDSDSSADVDAGERIGPWAVLRELGRGGMGVVLLAERVDGQFEQRAAIKLIKRGMDSDAVIARFLRERQILARLQHPHIARLLDGGVAEDGRPYFAMEYVDGEPLLRHCFEKNARLDERINLFLHICAAVQFAHGQLVVHRDIKPSNILVTAIGEAKLLDFGIARLLDDSGGGATATIDALHRPLTPAYAAPEQLRGERATTATDIYALGCLLYELLTGQRPLDLGDSPTLQEVLRAQETTNPAAPSRVTPDGAAVPARRLRGDLDTIVLKALQREPQRRYATAAALADDLQRFLAGRPIAARRDSARYRMRKFVGRHRLGVAATTLGVLALLAALALAVWQARAKALEAETAQQVTQFLAGLFKSADPARSRGAALSAQDLLDQATQRLRSDAHMQPGVRARLLDTVAVTYTSLGLYDRALPLAQQALQLRPFGSADTERADSLFALGRILRLKANYIDAEPLLDEALQLRRRDLRSDDPALIEALRERGALLRDRGEFAQADTPLAEAARLAQQRYGVESIGRAAAEDDYAANLDDLGRRVDAEAAYRHALAIREKLLGPDDAEVATSLMNLGVHLDDSGDYAAAVPLLERAVSIRKKIFGDEHPLTGIAEIALAGVYFSQDRVDECERSARDALAIFRHSLPEQHPKISESLNMLGLARQERRDFAGAIPLMREVLARYSKSSGADHPDTLAAENNLAFALLHAGQPAEAEHLQRDVLRRIGAGNSQGSSVLDRENLSATLQVQGNFAEAVAMSKQALQMQRRREGDGTGNVAVALRGLALAEELNGDATDAERDFRAALAMAERLALTRRLPVHEWQVPLADFLIGAEHCDEAVALLRSALAEFARAERRGDPVWQPEARLLLGECLLAGPQRTEGETMQRTARADLKAMQSIDIDLYPAARKILTGPSR